eukprot:116909-Prymnesium_polylepis.1
MPRRQPLAHDLDSKLKNEDGVDDPVQDRFDRIRVRWLIPNALERWLNLDGDHHARHENASEDQHAEPVRGLGCAASLHDLKVFQVHPAQQACAFLSTRHLSLHGRVLSVARVHVLPERHNLLQLGLALQIVVQLLALVGFPRGLILLLLL